MKVVPKIMAVTQFMAFAPIIIGKIMFPSSGAALLISSAIAFVSISIGVTLAIFFAVRLTKSQN